MRRDAFKRKSARTEQKHKNRLPRTLKPGRKFSEKNIDAEVLGRDFLAEDREALFETDVNMVNWSEPEDRGEDLVNMRDPLIQGPEQNADIPPELAQQKLSNIPASDEDLAERFDAERGGKPLV